MGERYNRYGKRLLLKIDEQTICSVPPQWTNLDAVDPVITLSEGRALFRVVDLLALERVIARLCGRILEAKDIAKT